MHWQQPKTPRSRLGFAESPLPGAQLHELTPRLAQLRWRGFSELRSRGPGHPTTPDYDQMSEHPPWRTTPQGWCTRYGDVLDLVTARDGRLAMVDAGDALAFQFDAAGLPPLQPGMARSFFFYSVGWDKDAGHNAVEGDMVDPLPTEDESGSRTILDGEDDWRVRYNTRWVPDHQFDRGK